MNLIDRTGQFWRGGLSLGPHAARPCGPAAGNRRRATVGAGGTVTSDVLANDTDPEGGALTIVAADGRPWQRHRHRRRNAHLHRASGLRGCRDDHLHRRRAAGSRPGNGNGRGGGRRVAEGENAGRVRRRRRAGDRLTVTVIAPGEYAGDYVVKTADLAAGPVSLAPPRIAGTAAAGETLRRSSRGSGPWMRPTAPSRHPPGCAGRHADRRRHRARPKPSTSPMPDETLSVVETAGTAPAPARRRAPGVAIPAAAQDAPWTPAALPGLALWFDASDPRPSRCRAARWRRSSDKSGNGRDALPRSGSPAPTLAATLDGQARRCAFPRRRSEEPGASFPGMPGMPGVALIAVTQAHVSSGFQRVFRAPQRAGAAGGKRSTCRPATRSCGSATATATGPAPAGPVVAVARYAAERQPWRAPSGGATARGSRPDQHLQRRAMASRCPADTFFQLGNQDGVDAPSRPNASSSWARLSAADRQRAEGYLAHRWGLAAALPQAAIPTRPHRPPPGRPLEGRSRRGASRVADPL